MRLPQLNFTPSAASRALPRARPSKRRAAPDPEPGGPLGAPLGRDVERLVREALWEEAGFQGRWPATRLEHGVEFGLEREVFSSISPRGVSLGWTEPSPYKVLLLSERASGPLTQAGLLADPYQSPKAHAFLDRTVARLQRAPWVVRVGWESINPAVQELWVEPRLMG